MSGIRQPAEELIPVEERLDELHVHQMGAAEIGIVDDIHVTRRHPATRPRDHRTGAVLHGAHEDRQTILALGDQGAVIPVVNPI